MDTVILLAVLMCGFTAAVMGLQILVGLDEFFNSDRTLTSLISLVVIPLITLTVFLFIIYSLLGRV